MYNYINAYLKVKRLYYTHITNDAAMQAECRKRTEKREENKLNGKREKKYERKKQEMPARKHTKNIPFPRSMGLGVSDITCCCCLSLFFLFYNIGFSTAYSHFHFFLYYVLLNYHDVVHSFNETKKQKKKTNKNRREKRFHFVGSLDLLARKFYLISFP